MPWRNFLRLFLQDGRIIQKISESWPVKRAAQKSVYWYLRGQEKFKDFQDKSIKGGGQPSISRFTDNFSRELKDGFKNLSDQQTKTQSNSPTKTQGKNKRRHR